MNSVLTQSNDCSLRHLPRFAGPTRDSDVLRKLLEFRDKVLSAIKVFIFSDTAIVPSQSSKFITCINMRIHETPQNVPGQVCSGYR